MQVGSDKRLNYYRMAPQEVIAELRSHPMGLTNPEAARRLARHGINRLHRAPRTPLLLVFLRQFKSLFVLILLISAVFALYLHDGKTATMLLIIAAVNAAVGFFQEYKAERLLASLEQLLLPTAKVIRNGQVQAVDSTAVVVGDIVALEAGDAVPADIRILDENELATNDFALTGESNPTRKFVHAIAADVPLAARQNLAFMGTTVATGSGRGIAIGTGMQTELGRIASLSQATHTDESPLQREMNNLATRITQGTLLLAAVLLIVALRADLGLKAALLFAISISAAMIPNGLVAEVNLTLAQTADRMARARALVKKLSAVETLGATDTILTDKTGTLTKNQMTVTNMVIGRTVYRTSGTGYAPTGTILGTQGKALSKRARGELSFFFAAGALASNAIVSQPDAEHPSWYVLGDPTEGAIVTLARKAGVQTEQLNLDYEELKEFQFDSARKLMSSVRRSSDGTVVFVKGAPEAIIARSRQLWDHGHVRRFTPADRSFFTDYTEAEAGHAGRTIALAYRMLPADTDATKLVMQKVESQLTFLGIVSMEDPLRDDVSAAMKTAQGAHIAVSVVTGDYPATARAVAAKAALAATEADITVVTADELAALSDGQILQLLEDGHAVFSRASPEDKLRLVEIAKAAGHVVAVTGDGINDAPALKRADVGVAMGRAGTDIAKDSADIVLLDDSFSTLVRAIEQGRLTFANIKKAARCALTDNAGELSLILISLAAQAVWHIPIAITAIQVLAVDVVAELFPITALGWDKPVGKLLRDYPRRLGDHIFSRSTVREFILFGLLAGTIAYANFLFFFARAGLSPAYIDTASGLYAQATILAYVTLVLCQFTNLLLVRADEQGRFFTGYLWSNRKLLIAFGISLACIGIIIYCPTVRPYFDAGPLSLADWLTALGGAAVYLGIRLLQRHTRKHSRAAVVRLHQAVHGDASSVRI